MRKNSETAVLFRTIRLLMIVVCRDMAGACRSFPYKVWTFDEEETRLRTQQPNGRFVNHPCHSRFGLVPMQSMVLPAFDIDLHGPIPCLTHRSIRTYSLSVGMMMVTTGLSSRAFLLAATAKTPVSRNGPVPTTR